MKLLPKYPIYVPSKGRAHNLKTAKPLDKSGVDYKVVVEPSQAASYENAVGRDHLLVLPENDCGLVYSRNWITDHAKKSGAARHWQIDDDIHDFYRLVRGKRLRCDAAAALRISEDFADRYENVALLTLNSEFFVGFQLDTCSLPPFYLNHRCYTIILFLNSLPHRWRPPNNEDADMTLQVLADGWCTILLNAFMIHTDTTMTARGGQTAAFKAGARLAMVRALERKWPGVVTVGRRFKHPQHVIKGRWKFFDNELKLKPGIDLAKMRANDYGLRLRAVKKVRSARLAKLLGENTNA